MIVTEAREGRVKMIRAKALPIAPKQFVCVLDAITIGLIFYALSNAELDHGGCVCGNLGSIELVVNQRYAVRDKWWKQQHLDQKGRAD